MQQNAISGYCDNSKYMYKQILNVSGARITVVGIPNVDNLTLCSFPYWRLEIRMHNVQSPVINVLHVALQVDGFTVTMHVYIQDKTNDIYGRTYAW